MTPQSVGVPANTLVIGKHSGRHAIGARLREHGYAVTGETLQEIYTEVMNLADEKKTVSDSDFLRIADSVTENVEKLAET